MVSFIRSSSDYKRLAQSRNRLTINTWLSAKYLSYNNGLRVGWSLPRQVGNAVIRNRLKRWLRNYLARNSNELGNLQAELSIYFRGNKDFPLKDLAHDVFDKELDKLFNKLRAKV